jgi:hypothetical protein
MTGGDPRATGIYYDDEYSHAVFRPGITNCSGPVPGGDVIYDSPDDKLPAVPDLLHNGSGNAFPSFDESGSIYPNGVDKSPGLIMKLSPHPQSGLNPAIVPGRPEDLQADPAVDPPTNGRRRCDPGPRSHGRCTKGQNERTSVRLVQG